MDAGGCSSGADAPPEAPPGTLTPAELSCKTALATWGRWREDARRLEKNLPEALEVDERTGIVIRICRGFLAELLLVIGKNNNARLRFDKAVCALVGVEGPWESNFDDVVKKMTVYKHIGKKLPGGKLPSCLYNTGDMYQVPQQYVMEQVAVEMGRMDEQKRQLREALTRSLATLKVTAQLSPESSGAPSEGSDGGVSDAASAAHDAVCAEAAADQCEEEWRDIARALADQSRSEPHFAAGLSKMLPDVVTYLVEDTVKLAKRKIKAAPFYLYAFWFILNSALYTTVKHPPR